MSALALTVSVIMCANQATPAEPPKTEFSAKMEAALKATGLGYSKSDNGLSFNVIYNYPGGRTRTVYITSNSKPLLTREMHTLYTQVWAGSEPPGGKILQAVAPLVKKLGYFYVYKDVKGNYALRFGANIDTEFFKPGMTSTDAPIAGLKDTLAFVAAVGEETQTLVDGLK